MRQQKRIIKNKKKQTGSNVIYLDDRGVGFKRWGELEREKKTVQVVELETLRIGSRILFEARCVAASRPAMEGVIDKRASTSLRRVFMYALSLTSLTSLPGLGTA
ncbi:uncharacterized protein LAJ45_04157 [Morchella importuna]|uniref:uncharacterized protein n=1 Tax=Morchella importuna TaxID=1174673 RepID=UPI001E8ED6D3|nr:uncharacterized protein LAJ45_04157 [Morchella importuna]KAH8151536.1 hypothetical protein LAJ45_04157 [Morchella importuna]